MKVLEEGCKKANVKANATLKKAKDAMKINYFDDNQDSIKKYFEQKVIYCFYTLIKLKRR